MTYINYIDQKIQFMVYVSLKLICYLANLPAIPIISPMLKSISLLPAALCGHIAFTLCSCCPPK